MSEDTQQEPIPPVNPNLTDAEIIDDDTDLEIELDEEAMDGADDPEEVIQP